MKMSRRIFLHMTAGIALPAIPRLAQADTYPSRPVRIVVGFAAGGGQDTLARAMASWLSEQFHQQFVVEDRPGSGGNMATEVVGHAAADGYTLLLVGPQSAIAASLYENSNFDFLKYIAPVASVSREASVIVLRPSFPAKTIPEFIAYAKAHPGKINMASAGVGSAGHIAGELFMMMTGINMVHVPYRGLAPALTDVIGGQVDICFANLGGAIALVRSGSLRALAVTTTDRLDVLPDVPTLAEFVPDYEASALFGIGAPKNTPTPIINTLNAAIEKVLNDPKAKKQLSSFGHMMLAGTPADFGERMAEETAKWSKVVKAAGIKLK